MVYAKISNRTVADEYFKVSAQVEALYDAPKQLPADAEGSEMRKLRSEMHRRMLGNGYCARPVGLDCHFESICESCTYFQTTLEFRPTLQRQRDDAAEKGQVGRLKIFDGLLDRLEPRPGLMTTSARVRPVRGRRQPRPRLDAAVPDPATAARPASSCSRPATAGRGPRRSTAIAPSGWPR